MDYAGQKLAEQLLLWLVLGCGLGSFLLGYLTGSFHLMVYLNGVGLLATVLVVLPDWPFYNKTPLQWLPPLKPDASSSKSK